MNRPIFAITLTAFFLMSSLLAAGELAGRREGKSNQSQERFVAAEERSKLSLILNQPDGTRTSSRLSEGWRFVREDAKVAEKPGYNDSNWSAVSLPHTWNVEDPFDDTPGYYRGTGWYRKSLELDSRLKGKKLFLYFEAANQVADVFVNGMQACHHEGGYSAFACEITNLVNFNAGEGGNAIAVKVDNSFNKNIPPLSAGFVFYGGIYRNLWLGATEPVRIDVLDYASPGIYADTPTVSEPSATVRIRGTAVNSTVAGNSCG